MFNIIMSELQEVTTADLEKEIGSENDSIILSEKENDSDFEDDLDEYDEGFPGDEDVPIIPERPPVGSDEYKLMENNDSNNNMVYERDENSEDEEDAEDGKDDENDKDSQDEKKQPENVVISTEIASNLIASEDEDNLDESSDEEDNESYQKLEQELDRDILLDFHPEAKYSSYNEVLAQCKIVKDKNGEIIDDLHTTIPFLTKYEKARVLGLRAKQINNGSEPFVNIPNNIIEGAIIAEMELKEKKIPFIIRRPIPNGGSEYWKISDLEILDI
jgi:DNA-directed RNA polymerase I, II, and III subunit RPABC2